MDDHNDEALRLYSMGIASEAVEQHLEFCPVCRAKLADWQALAEVAHVLAETEPATLPDLKIPGDREEENKPMTTYARTYSTTEKRFPLTAIAAALSLLFAAALWTVYGGEPPIPLSIIPQTTNPTECRYTIQEGDTILSALDACDVAPTTAALYRVQAVNDLDDDFSVAEGQEIIVPIHTVAGQVPNPSNRFTLDSEQPVFCTTFTGVGATLESILERCGLPITEENMELVRLNSGLYRSNIPIGTYVTVPLDGENLAMVERLLPVWIAARFIPAGTEIEADMLTQVYYPASMGIFSAERQVLVGRVSRDNIPAFTPLSLQNTYANNG